MSERRELKQATAAHIFPMQAGLVIRLREFVLVNADPSERRINILIDCVVRDDILIKAMEQLIGGWEVPEGYQESFIDGFCIAQKAIHLHANKARVVPARMNKDTMVAYFEQLKLYEGSSNDWFEEKLRDIKDNDPAFAAMIEEYLELQDEVTCGQCDPGDQCSACYEREFERKYAISFGCLASYDFVKYQMEAMDFVAAFSDAMTDES